MMQYRPRAYNGLAISGRRSGTFPRGNLMADVLRSKPCARRSDFIALLYLVLYGIPHRRKNQTVNPSAFTKTREMNQGFIRCGEVLAYSSN